MGDEWTESEGRQIDDEDEIQPCLIDIRECSCQVTSSFSSSSHCLSHGNGFMSEHLDGFCGRDSRLYVLWEGLTGSNTSHINDASSAKSPTVE